MKKFLFLLLLVPPIYSLNCLAVPKDGQLVSSSDVSPAIRWEGYVPDHWGTHVFDPPLPGAQVRFIVLNEAGTEVGQIGMATLGRTPDREEPDPNDSAKTIKWYKFSRDLMIPLDHWFNFYLAEGPRPTLRVRAMVGTIPLATFAVDSDGCGVEAFNNGGFGAVLSSCASKIPNTNNNKNYADLISTSDYKAMICGGRNLSCLEEAGADPMKTARCASDNTDCLTSCHAAAWACPRVGISIEQCQKELLLCQGGNYSISSCPDGSALEIPFGIDCSRFDDPAIWARCATYITNVACKSYPAYRRITQVPLEQSCTGIKYFIYPEAEWSSDSAQGESGGYAPRCEVHFQDRYSISDSTASDIGAYDVHELLHQFHRARLHLPDSHSLFTSSMAEVRKLVGDKQGYLEAIKRMEIERNNLLNNHPERVQGNCTLAEAVIEEGLYLANNNIVYWFYALANADPDLNGDRRSTLEMRFNALNKMLFTVSGNDESVREYLMANGCGDWE